MLWHKALAKLGVTSLLQIAAHTAPQKKLLQTTGRLNPLIKKDQTNQIDIFDSLLHP